MHLRRAMRNHNRQLLQLRVSATITINFTAADAEPLLAVSARGYSHRANELGRRSHLESHFHPELGCRSHIRAPDGAPRRLFRVRRQNNLHRNALGGFHHFMQHVRAEHREFGIAVQNPHAQILRIIFGVVHHLRTLVPILAKPENRRALLHHPPDVPVVARLHLHPFDEVRRRGLNRAPSYEMARALPNPPLIV